MRHAAVAAAAVTIADAGTIPPAMPPEPTVYRHEPFGLTAPRRVVPLNVQALRPVIRIAHRVAGRLNVPRRILYDHEFVLITRGRGRVVFDDATDAIEFGPHTLIVVPPFVVHEFVSGQQSVEHVAVHFDLAADVPTSSRAPHRRRPYEVRLSHGLRLARVTPLGPDSTVGQRLIELVAARQQVHPLADVRASALLLDAITLLLTEHGPDESATAGTGDARLRQMIERARAYCHEHLADSLRAEDLADVAGLSASHLNRSFRRLTGYSPMDYLRRLRVERARQLLGDVDLSVKQIAAATGFDDAFHFSKTFRKLSGMTPTAYRDAILAGARGT